jgi:hypothetical protein
VPSLHSPAIDRDVRPVDGDRVYGCFTPDTDFGGGLWQQVSTLRDGQAYVLGVSAYLVPGCPTTQIRGRLGVDTLGGVNPAGSGVTWGPWTAAGSDWQDLHLDFVAKASTVTVFLEYSLQTMGYSCSDATETALFDLVTLTLP